MQLDVSSFNKKIADNKRYSLVAEMSPLDVDGDRPSFVGPVSVLLEANSVDEAIAISGIISARLTMRCGRCLETYEHGVEVPFSEVYARSLAETNGEEVLYAGDFIDIEPEVIKTVILSLPMRAICREDCQGLCVTCGCNLNHGLCQCPVDDIDPRLNALKDIFKTTNSKEETN